jgi:hypothetical protein
MKRMFLLFMFVPLLLSAHIQDERLFATLKVPAAAILLLDRSGSMINETTLGVDVELLHRNWSLVPDVTYFSEWFDSTQYPYNYPLNSMSSFVGDSAGGNWTLEVTWQEYGMWVGSSTLDLTWELKLYDGSTWHEYSGGGYSWTASGLTTEEVSIPVSGGWDVQDVECYVEITTGDGLKIGNVGVHLLHTPGVESTSDRIKDALLVIHSLLDVNGDGLVDGNDEFPIKLGQGFFDSSQVFVGDNRSHEYTADNHEIKADELGTYNNPLRWDQVSKTWVDDLTGTQYLRTDTMGTSVDSIWKHINTTEVDGSTPNGMLVDSAVKYIAEYRNAHPELWCMKFSVVLITDGKPNVPRTTCHPTDCDDPGHCEYSYDEDVRYGAKDLVRVAYNAFHGDNDNFEGPDSIRVYAVGFGTGIDDDCANVLNWTARWGGTWSDSSLMSGNDTAIDPSDNVCCGPSEDPRYAPLTGYAFIAEDAGDLANALMNIFMGIEASMSQSYTSAEVNSVEEEFLSTEYQSKLYIASFKPDTMPFWSGDLRALKLTAGEINLDDIDPNIVIWSAGDTIAKSSADSRPIYGIKTDGSMKPFDTLHFSATDLNVSSASLFDVIDRIRDGNTDDSLGALGDIFHSSPLRIQSPNYFYEDEGWDSFYNVMSNKRSALIYAGGNDGMLHVIADTIYGQGGKGGHEIAGIIPMNFVPEVRNLLSFHDYFVDGDPVAADVWFPANGSDSTKEWKEWHTVLIATQGEGGNSFTAFDVTDPRNETYHSMDSITFLFDAWQSDTLKKRLGYTTSTPAIHKVGVNWEASPERIIDRFYGFAGGGQFPDPMDISIVDSFPSGILKGNEIIAFDIWKAAKKGIDSSLIFIPAAGASMKYPFVASPALINIDPHFGNRYDYLFIPDAAGQLWFVDLKFTNPSDWKARKIFQPELPSSGDTSNLADWHPAYYYPLVWEDPTYGGYWVAYGTGNRSKIFDKSSERFYVLHFEADAFSDTSDMPFYTEDTLGIPGTPTDFGWMLELTHDREKVVTPAIYFQDSLEFYTFSPGGAVDIGPCDIGGTGSSARSYTMHIRTGASHNSSGVEVGSGMPQPPSYSFSISGEGKKIIQAGGKIEVVDIGSFMSFRQHILWKDEDRD